MTETNVIVGAGQAAAWAATTMRQAGFQGRILLIGDEPWQPYERPPLSKIVLTSPEEPALLHFHKPGSYEEHRIELLLGHRVTAIDPTAHRLHTEPGRPIPYDRLLLTAGGRARPLTIPGAGRVPLLRTIDDARRIRARLAEASRVVCIGAGVIGLEIASSARARGCHVTILEAAPRALGRCVTEEVASFVVDLHRRAGAAIHFNTAIQQIQPTQTGDRILCADGQAFEADLTIAGIGMIRNTELAAEAGIATDNGILVDECGRTSLPGIYAAGDVAAFFHFFYRRHLRLESWRHAQNHGIAVARTMAGQDTPYDDIPWFWTDQHGVNLQVAGLPDQATRTVIRLHEPTRLIAIHLGPDNAAVAITAAGSPRDIRPGTALIRAGTPLDPAQLADPGIPLQSLLPH